MREEEDKRMRNGGGRKPQKRGDRKTYSERNMCVASCCSLWDSGGREEQRRESRKTAALSAGSGSGAGLQPTLNMPSDRGRSRGFTKKAQVKNVSMKIVKIRGYVKVKKDAEE